MSGVAIVRYIPRAFRVKQVDGNHFFTEEKRQEYRRRVESVTPHSPRQWGTMEVDLMLHHLNLACGGSLGFYNLPDESYLTSRTFFKWILVDWFPEQPIGLRRGVRHEGLDFRSNGIGGSECIGTGCRTANGHAGHSANPETLTKQAKLMNPVPQSWSCCRQRHAIEDESKATRIDSETARGAPSFEKSLYLNCAG